MSEGTAFPSPIHCSLSPEGPGGRLLNKSLNEECDAMPRLPRPWAVLPAGFSAKEACSLAWGCRGLWFGECLGLWLLSPLG